jgi:hypothetical protein
MDFGVFTMLPTWPKKQLERSKKLRTAHCNCNLLAREEISSGEILKKNGYINIPWGSKEER